ncbi:phage portal protein [Paramicrobacterium agarici]|uniref:phage portal protein n=1 Tax=Paramicrobacterium agarici TaxID=630514 RepID=UPI001150957A|nr:phage portal protein [Microbacterium agarici]TQO23794.1 A118 family predicted phage portal protein [Microbacterium agarici]
MALPADNSSWPPAPWDFAYTTYAENEAWYLGDTDRLADIYQRSKRERATHLHKGQVRSGGVAGAISRFFWGRPVPPNQARTRLHIPAPADLATLSSDLIFSEPPEVQILADEGNAVDAKAQARLDLIANSDAAHAMYNTMGELKAALGAVALVSTWDTEIADHVWLEASAADVIIPEFRKGKLLACTMWTEYREKDVYYRHLERHSVGAIEHALYKGKADNLGRRVPLQDRPETEHLAKSVNSDSLILTGIDKLTVSYNPNMPTRAWRKKGALSFTGRSDFAGIQPLFDALDETWSSWMRDLKLGGGKILVPESALHTGPAGVGGYFDESQEVYAGLAMPGDAEKPAFDKVQFQIRVEEHEATAHAIYREILRSAGYSQSAWGDYGESQQTATEVEDRDKASERTRDKKTLYDKTAIAEQSWVSLELDGLLFPGKGGKTLDRRPNVVFPDVSQIDPEKSARTAQLLNAAGAASTETLVRRTNPDWDDPQVDEEVARIRSERSFAVPDPATFTGDEE